MALKRGNGYLHEVIVCCFNDTDNCPNYEEPGKRYPFCSRCHYASYCSPNCQRRDWPRHKRACKKYNGEGEERRSFLTKIASKHVANLDRRSLFRYWMQLSDTKIPTQTAWNGKSEEHCLSGAPYIPAMMVGETFETFKHVKFQITEGGYGFEVVHKKPGQSTLLPGALHVLPKSKLMDGPGLLYVRALHRDLQSMSSEGAFLVHYIVTNGIQENINMLSVTRFFLEMQDLTNSPKLNLRSLLRHAPPGRHANVDRSWVHLHGPIAAPELLEDTSLRYTCCRTNIPGGLQGLVDGEDGEDSSKALATSGMEVGVHIDQYGIMVQNAATPKVRKPARPAKEPSDLQEKEVITRLTEIASLPPEQRSDALGQLSMWSHCDIADKVKTDFPELDEAWQQRSNAQFISAMKDAGWAVSAEDGELNHTTLTYLEAKNSKKKKGKRKK